MTSVSVFPYTATAPAVKMYTRLIKMPTVIPLSMQKAETRPNLLLLVHLVLLVFHI